MSIDNSTSEFVMPGAVEVSGTAFTDMTEIPARGFNVLVKAKREGQWWMLKGLKPEFRADFAYENLLRKEYNIMERLKHHDIVSVVGMESVPGYGECIVMEWIDGVTLGQWLAEPHTKAEKRRVIDKLLSAVEHVHSMQVVHRDLKPENIMLTRNGQNVKLIDFGLADTDCYAVFKQAAGTAGFMAPEQSRGGVPDSRNDIYSLGCILRQVDAGWIYRGVIRRCHEEIGRRYVDVSSLRKAMATCRRRLKAAVAMVCILLTFAAGAKAYSIWMAPPQTYDVVAEFNVGFLRFKSYGGGLASVQGAADKDSCVEIPSKARYRGVKYRVTEVAQMAFCGYKNIQAVIFPDADIYILGRAFKGCGGLKAIYFHSQRPPEIGNSMWKTKIGDVFDLRHFSDVVLYVPAGCVEAYRASAWGIFNNIKEYN